MYVSETWNSVVRNISPDGVVSTIAGKSYTYDLVDGKGEDARFGGMFAITIGINGEIYVADQDNYVIRKLDY